jgi:hypothetical protein
VKKNTTKTIQRNWQHRIHKVKKNKTKTIQRNWQHRVHKVKNNNTKTIQRGRGFIGGGLLCRAQVFPIQHPPSPV